MMRKLVYISRILLIYKHFTLTPSERLLELVSLDRKVHLGV
jgi:hypothetical protein